eukprot:gnl/TRDRNA2_/TRDRNA2_193739_c0_seq1.p1 gnl/TRDRNA2_/TRDRNA2_193739_c0~~gnl/TRDRNA2_/TRDRNA2_193739_c0_seq1.p1  ORF type:complete len:137 (-),score=22.09 gnl/TRDRNA2_/TRDRNA2_193739_c0_seq1:231-641(-)
MPVYEVRNYFIDLPWMETYKKWARESAVSALKTLLPKYGGELVGFWIANDEKENIYGGKCVDQVPKDSVPGAANVTWVIKWPSKAARDAALPKLFVEDPDWQVCEKLRDSMGIRLNTEYLRIEARFCEDYALTAKL